ncbi:MAG: S41 family peptidase [Candidatus Cloacimonadaceae bacterium]
MRRAAILLILCLFNLYGLFAAQVYFPKDPTISPDGNDVCFVFDNDLWIVPFAGGDARRLTSTPAQEWGPQWSPDGRHIAFNSNREGSNMVYLIPVRGGDSRVISKDAYNVVEWYPDSTALLVTRSNMRYGSSSFYRLPLDGSPATLIAEIGDSFATLSPDGKSIIFNRYGDAHRKAYTGSLAGDLWKIDLATKEYTRLTNTQYTERYPRFAHSSGALFYCLSDGNHFQLMRTQNMDFTTAVQLSSFTEWSARDISVARTNERVVYEYFDQIWKYDPAQPANSQIAPLSINIPEDQWTDTRRWDKGGTELSLFAVSPDENFLALQYKYDAFLRPRDGGEPRRMTFDQGGISGIIFMENSRDILVHKMHQGKEMLFMTNVEDPTKLEEFHWFGADSLTVDNLYRDQSGVWVMNYSSSRIGGQVAIADAGLANLRPINAPYPVVTQLGINDDASWAIYAAQRPDFTRELYLYEFATENHIKLFNDYGWSGNFMWTPDNTSILFSQGGGISRLDLIPRDEYELEKDYWALALERSEPYDDEYIEEVDGTENWEDEESLEESIDAEPQPEEEEEEVEQPKEPTKINVYWPGIRNRVYSIIANVDGSAFPLKMKADSTFYYVVNGYFANKPSTLQSANIYGESIKEEANFGKDTWGFLEIDDTFYYLSNDVLRYQPIGGSGKDIPISFDYEWDVATLNTRVFEEVWGAFGNSFYDPDMHGQDWQALYDRYLPYAQKARNIGDIADVVNEMIGDVNASHTGFYPRRDSRVAYRSAAYLGIEFEPIEPNIMGRMVSFVYPDTRLAQLYRIRPGDILTHIDGIEISHNTSLDSLLADKTGRRIQLRFERDQEPFDAEMKGLSYMELRRLDYAYRIEKRREIVDVQTNGEVGYIHIPGMGYSDYENFTRDLYRDNMDKKALIIDVRGNTGGYVHDSIISLLQKKQYAFSTSRRWRPEPMREPSRVWDRPSIVLVDQHSFSDGEIFPIVYKELKLGKVVGYPSSGAVIGTTEYKLIDGSTMRLPRSGWYRMDGTNMEGNGAVPDIIVENTPNDIIEDYDPQLQRAIDEIMADLENR